MANPNMRMGGVLTNADPAVTSAIKQRGVMEQSAIQGGAMNTLGDVLISDAMAVMKENRLNKRKIAAEERQETRDLSKEVRAQNYEIAREERADTRLKRRTEDERAYKEEQDAIKRARLSDTNTPEGRIQALVEGEHSAKIQRQLAAAARDNRYISPNEDRNQDSVYTVNGKPLSIAQAKLVAREFEKQDPKVIKENKRKARDAVKKLIVDKGLKETSIWKTDKQDAEDFIELYELQPKLAEKKDPDSYKLVHEALKGFKVYTGIQEMLDARFGTGGTTTTTNQTTNEIPLDAKGQQPGETLTQYRERLLKLKAQRGK